MNEIQLPCFGIRLVLDGTSGTISSDLKESCPNCGLFDCFLTCHHEDAESRSRYNHSIDGIESLILAHACAGIDVTSPAYLEGIETAVEACSNHS